MIYLDNTVGTPADPEVVRMVKNLIDKTYSSSVAFHTAGRENKSLIEKSRRIISGYLNIKPSEIVFTSGATEANHIAIHSITEKYGISQAITSPIEHPSVLFPLQKLEKQAQIKLHFVSHNSQGEVDLVHLKELLETNSPCLVSLTHANYQTGILLPMKKVGKLCHENNSVFHSDMAQSIGMFGVDLSHIPVDYGSCSARKFHGLPGVGFLYKSCFSKGISPLFLGESQEFGLRAGEQNAALIAGMAKAFEIVRENLLIHQDKLFQLRKYLAEQLMDAVPGSKFLGRIDKGLFSVLTIWLPKPARGDFFIENLDIEGIALGPSETDHFGTRLTPDFLRTKFQANGLIPVRFSFNRFNSKEEIDKVIEHILMLYD